MKPNEPYKQNRLCSIKIINSKSLMNQTKPINNFLKNQDRMMQDQSKGSNKNISTQKASYPESIFKSVGTTNHKVLKFELPNQPCPPKKTTPVERRDSFAYYTKPKSFSAKN